MAIRFPIKKYQGSFEKYVLVTGGRGASLFASKCLESFFGHFPTAKGLEQFTVADVHEYGAWRMQSGATEAAMCRELQTISRFYKWCIDKGAKVFNPAQPWIDWRKPRLKHAIRRRTSPLTVDDFIKLLEVAGPRLREFMLAIVADRPTAGIFRCNNDVGYQFRLAARRSGLCHLNVTKLRMAMKHGFWAEVIRRHCALWAKQYGQTKLSNALLNESESLSTSLADIQVPSGPIRSPIINSSDDCFMVGWVGDLDNSTEADVWTGDGQPSIIENLTISS
jgi:hypothetical protein